MKSGEINCFLINRSRAGVTNRFPMKIDQILFKLFCVLSFLTIATRSIHAQEQHEKILVDHLRRDIEQVVGNTNGVIGLALLDLTSGETLLINENLIFPQASSIKIPILIELIRRTESGDIDIRERVDIKRDNIVGGSGILQFFGDGTSSLSWYDLAILMISLSDNSATNLIIDRLGMSNINNTMKGMGFGTTGIKRRMMDSEASARGDENISSPYEAMKIMEDLHRRNTINTDVSDIVLEILRVPKSSDFRKSIPSSVPIANKPGSLTGVVCEWALVELPGRPYVLIFMSNYGVDTGLRAAAEEISAIAHKHFSRLSGASPHGVGSF
jgi:beta-lactamase class A